jgi:hypothetical protein
MCGCFTQSFTWAELAALYGLTQPARNLQLRYGIAPADEPGASYLLPDITSGGRPGTAKSPDHTGI